MGFEMKVLAGALASACLFAASAASAGVVINDTTKDISYRGSSSTTYFGSSSVGDEIGPGFDTQSVAISESGNSISLTFRTQFDGNEATAHYADVFIAPNNADGTPSSWGFGIALGDQVKAAGLYDLSSAADYMTSKAIWTSKTGYIYGGAYTLDNGITSQLIPTRVTGGILNSDWTVVVSQDNVGGSFPYELTITLTAANSTAFSLLDGTNLDILWGTGDCGNDTIFAQYERPTQAPEPATITLLAGGLLALRRKRK
jgi:hypothetical protein